MAKTTILENLQLGSLAPFCSPRPGGSFLEYRVAAPMKVSSGEADFFFLEHPATAVRQVLKLYRCGVRPKLEILGVISGLGAEHVVKLIRHGEVDDRHYEIQEYLPCGSLADLLARESRIDEARVRLLIAQIAEALVHLQAFSVLHRDVKPSNILVRSLDPLRVVLSDFGISSVSDLSLHLTTMSRPPAYCAPEATTGVVSKSSDWWSLGVITLEMLMGAHPFAGMTEQAINFQLVSRGITVPGSLPTDWVLLIRGLLTRNYKHRWGGSEVRRWLSGDRSIPVFNDSGSDPRPGSAHKPYRFLEMSCEQPSELAEQLARHWPEASKHWVMGYVVRWVENEVKQQQISTVLRDIQGDTLLASDHKLGAALLAMHPDLPLSHPGISAILEQASPPIEGVIAVLANRLDFQNTLGMRFLPVPGTRTFWSMWQTRVSDFKVFTEEDHRLRKAPSFSQTPDHPVVLITWAESSDFCRWLTVRERALKRIGPRDVYRLPTDLEWSRMAGLKGEPGTTPRERNGAVRGLFPWGTAWPPSKDTANLGAALEVDPYPFTAPVGSFSANEWGLHDLGSNVMEWCGDSYDVDLDLKVVRGASWYHTTQDNCWTSIRRRFNGGEHSDTLGFRCVLDYKVPPPATFGAADVALTGAQGKHEPATPPGADSVSSKPVSEKNKPFWKIL